VSEAGVVVNLARVTHELGYFIEQPSSLAKERIRVMLALDRDYCKQRDDRTRSVPPSALDLGGSGSARAKID
jgi:hypothetical protein